MILRRMRLKSQVCLLNCMAAIVWFIGYMYLKPIEKIQKSEEEDEIEERIELMREIISQRDLVKRTSVPSYREEGTLDVSHLATTAVAVLASTFLVRIN